MTERNFTNTSNIFFKNFKGKGTNDKHIKKNIMHNLKLKNNEELQTKCYMNVT